MCATWEGNSSVGAVEMSSKWKLSGTDKGNLFDDFSCYKIFLLCLRTSKNASYSIKSYLLGAVRLLRKMFSLNSSINSKIHVSRKSRLPFDIFFFKNKLRSQFYFKASCDRLR